MLKIRLSQVGRVKQRSYRIQVMDVHQKRDSGRYLDDLGYCSSKEFELNQEKYEKWLNQGAQPTNGLLSRISERSSNLHKLSLVREKIVHRLTNLPENKIKISLPSSNFESSKVQGFGLRIINFSVLDLKNKLKENDYQLLKKGLLVSWVEEEKLVKQLFKELKIKSILSRKSEEGKMSVINDSELSLSSSPFNFEFSFAGLEKVYSTQNNPLCIVEPEPSKE